MTRLSVVDAAQSKHAQTRYVAGTTVRVTPGLFVEALLLRARIHLSLNAFSLAKDDAALAHDLAPASHEVLSLLASMTDSASSLSLRAQSNLIRGRADAAITDLTAAIAIRPTEVELYLSRASALRQEGLLDASLSDLKIALSICERVDTERAECQELAKRKAKEARVKQQSLRSPAGAGGGGGGTFLTEDNTPDDLSTEGHDSEADSSSSTVIDDGSSLARVGSTTSPSLKPRVQQELAMTFSELGLDYCRNNRIAQALAVFSKAIELAPEDFRPFTYRGDAFLSVGKIDLALADLHTALDVLFQTRARVVDSTLAAQTEARLAAEAAASPWAASLASTLSTSVDRLEPPGGSLLEQSRSLNQARDTQLRHIVYAMASVRARIARAHATLGRDRFNKGDWRGADIEFSQAIEYNGSIAVFYMMRGNVRAKLGLAIEAFKVRAALSLDHVTMCGRAKCFKLLFYSVIVTHLMFSLSQSPS